MRKHASWYLKGMPRSNDIRVVINSLDESKAVVEALNNYRDELVKVCK